MRKMIAAVLLVEAVLFCRPSRAQDGAVTPRKVVARITPVYPDLARKLQLSGTVKMGVTVAPNGTVKKAEVLGGSPLLVQAAQAAVQKWKWEPVSDESRELIEITFRPH